MGQAIIITIDFQHPVILIIQLLMGHANISITIGRQHRDLVTVAVVGGEEIMTGSRHCYSCVI